MQRVLDAVAHQAAWWWCILFARAELCGLALLGPLAYVFGHASMRPAWRSRVILLALLGALMGLAGDTLLVRAGYLSSKVALELGPTLPFMAALWAAAAVSLTLSSGFMVGLSPGRAALAGAVLGPLAYAGGARLAVLVLAPHALLFVAIEWAVAVPLLGAGARLLDRLPKRAEP